MQEILQPYLDLIAAFQRQELTAPIFVTAFLALFDEDEARQDLSRQLKRNLDNLAGFCETRPTENELQSELERVLTQIQTQLKQSKQLK